MTHTLDERRLRLCRSAERVHDWPHPAPEALAEVLESLHGERIEVLAEYEFDEIAELLIARLAKRGFKVVRDEP